MTVLAFDTLQADASGTGITYQWIDCSDSSLIAGATSQTYAATANGDYAVIVDNNGCIDTSACSSVSGVGLDENGSDQLLIVYPNPTNGAVTISLSKMHNNLVMKIYSADGKLIQSDRFEQVNVIQFELDQPNGVYTIQITDDKDLNETIRLIKQ